MSHTRFEPARARLQRSELAVPGSQPGMFCKALESEADYIFLDLEDAVAPADKVQARLNVIAALHEHDWRGRGKTIAVRINGIDTHYMYRDVVDVVEQAGDRLDVVLIPKVGVPADVYLVDALLTQIEEAKGIDQRIGIDVLIETALGMANRVKASSGLPAAKFWLAGGAFAMGIGIWSMHFVGMLATRLAIPIAFAGAVIQVVGEIWHAYSHLQLSAHVFPLTYALSFVGMLIVLGALVFGRPARGDERLLTHS